MNQKGVSSGDHSFDARNDGKHLYCFSNEAWSASTKEVSFNVHGIVYVPESEAPSDPLESEGASYIPTFALYVCLHGTPASKCWYFYGESKVPTLVEELFGLKG